MTTLNRNTPVMGTDCFCPDAEKMIERVLAQHRAKLYRNEDDSRWVLEIEGLLKTEVGSRYDFLPEHNAEVLAKVNILHLLGWVIPEGYLPDRTTEVTFNKVTIS